MTEPFNETASDARKVARNLSRTMKAALLAHVDGPLPIQIESDEHNKTIVALHARGLLRFDRHKPPRTSESTGLGRYVIAALIDMQADVLASAEYV